MCDYSLEHYRSRPAQEGEQYQTHRFRSGSIGFAAPDDPETAICMAYDMRLSLAEIDERVAKVSDVATSEIVTFVRLETGMYRDGVRFANGKEVRLQDLGVGVTAKVVDALETHVTPEKTAELV